MKSLHFILEKLKHYFYVLSELSEELDNNPNTVWA